MQEGSGFVMVTVISDASFSGRVAGWAGWARSDLGEMPLRSGKIRGECLDVNAAELMAVTNTLVSAIGRGLVPDGAEVVCHIDNINVRKWIGCFVHARSQPKRLSKFLEAERVGKAGQILREIVEQKRLKLKVRHIKAHSGTDTPETHIHDLCDRAAKLARRGKHKGKAA